MKILAVCGFGVGSSMILRMSIEKALKNLDINAEVENTDISSARGMTADLIFTSEELKGELESGASAPVIAVQKYMDVNEVQEKLSAFIKG